ncbi:MAG: hypothetical protein KC425_20925, partial [Anaerolineales bacterium]|nr:hypothetical protein [Anaerolineales bacterium]
MQTRKTRHVLGVAFSLAIFFVGILMSLRLLGSAAAAPAASGMMPAAQETISLRPIGHFTGDGAEISAFDPESSRLFVVTGGLEMDVLDLRNPLSVTRVMTVAVGAGGANSVAVHDGLVA